MNATKNPPPVAVEVAKSLWIEQIKDELVIIEHPRADVIISYCHMAFGTEPSISIQKANEIFVRALEIFPRQVAVSQ